MFTAQNSKLRIAQVSPLWESVPPQRYGGVELIVSLLTEGLVQRGHDVTLFATGDSSTTADLRAVVPQALRNSISIYDYICYETHMLSQVFARQDEFDIIHFHDRCVSFFFSQKMQTSSLHTLHYSLSPEFQPFYAEYVDLSFIHISHAQRQQMPSLPSCQTIYNGICLENYSFSKEPCQQPYLAFVGRLSESKGPHLAIQIAKQVGIPLKIAGKVDEENIEFFESVVKPEIDGGMVQYFGEVSHAEKVELLGGAIATLFPILWNEPFGLVMIESMACGTPVLGMNCASVPEIIKPGQTGYICKTVDEFCHAVEKVSQLNRSACRQWVADMFSSEKMVNDYECVYYQLAQKKQLTQVSMF